ncbi:hypothetical protein BDZ45DRAFT_600095 [Acephala macrosclerotiorum]|nr:hypothetical protein BDZ45DRAFT_600095 [Acephala macrosclerotiorum]
MRFSRSLKSSSQSLPSPDGTFIATILPSQLSIRDTRSLELIRVVALPPDLAASVSWFLWSESSSRVLLGSAEHIRVYSAINSKFLANVLHPTSGTTKITFIAFGASDDEVLVFSDHGLKLSVYNLSSSKSVDINAPKLYNPGVAAKGYSYRPGTSHLGLLTRSNGKDVISIHTPGTLDVIRSWLPQSIDAQGLCWSADGRWLVAWESASQGHALFVYTADGHLFKTWNGSISASDDPDATLGAGIKIFEWSGNGAHIAIGDHGMRVAILGAPWFTESMGMVHTAAVKPAESLQIWQEQIHPSQNGFTRGFIEATQSIFPPTTPSNIDTKTGTNLLTFDKSGTLLATRIENMPSTAWIWDIGTRILRAVIILHAPIAKVSWHPAMDGLLMIRSEGDESRGLVHLWDQSWESPKIIDFAKQIPGGKLLGKTIIRWLNVDSAQPAIFFSDSQDCILASLSDEQDGNVPWQDAETLSFDIYGQREESPLNLVPANEKHANGKVSIADLIEDDDGMMGMSGGSDEVDDTFQFRKFVGPS